MTAFSRRMSYRPERERRFQSLRNVGSSQPVAAVWPAYWPEASSSSANNSSALANRAARVLTISSTSAMASRVSAFGTSSSGNACSTAMRWNSAARPPKPSGPSPERLGRLPFHLGVHPYMHHRTLCPSEPPVSQRHIVSGANESSRCQQWRPWRRRSVEVGFASRHGCPGHRGDDSGRCGRRPVLRAKPHVGLVRYPGRPGGECGGGRFERVVAVGEAVGGGVWASGVGWAQGGEGWQDYPNGLPWTACRLPRLRSFPAKPTSSRSMRFSPIRNPIGPT